MNATRKCSCLLPLVAVLALVGGCEGTAGPGGGLPIVISATWTDENDDTHSITFRSPDDQQVSGVVTGTEQHSDCFNPCPIGGHWENSRIEITILRDSGRPKFVAEYHEANPTRLHFAQVGGHESFTLVQ